MTGPHLVVAVPGGFAVAFRSALGGLVAVVECADRNTAEAQAKRLDAEAEARAAIAASARARYREHGMARRPVRFFEPDAYA